MHFVPGLRDYCWNCLSRFAALLELTQRKSQFSACLAVFCDRLLSAELRATARKNRPGAQAVAQKMADLDHRFVRHRFCHVKMAAQPICSALP